MTGFEALGCARASSGLGVRPHHDHPHMAEESFMPESSPPDVLDHGDPLGVAADGGSPPSPGPP